MQMQEIASSLAQQMTDTGLRPGREEEHPAYIGHNMLAYAMDDGQPVLGQRACSLQHESGDWLLFDDKGTRVVVIRWDGSRWAAGDEQPA